MKPIMGETVEISCNIFSEDGSEEITGEQYVVLSFYDPDGITILWASPHSYWDYWLCRRLYDPPGRPELTHIEDERSNAPPTGEPELEAALTLVRDRCIRNYAQWVFGFELT